MMELCNCDSTKICGFGLKSIAGGINITVPEAHKLFDFNISCNKVRIMNKDRVLNFCDCFCRVKAAVRRKDHPAVPPTLKHLLKK